MSADFDGPGELGIDNEQNPETGVTEVTITMATDDGDEIKVSVDPETAREIAADLIENAHEAEEQNA